MSRTRSTPTVGIIGAGVAGLVTAKELKDVGITDCTVYEMMPVIGGVFAHYGWENGHMTSSSVFTWYSDFPIKDDRQKHLSWPEWCAYLQSYVDHFEFGGALQFNCKVIDVRKCSDSVGGWDFVIHRRIWSNGHPSHPTSDILKVKEEIFTKHFDYAVIGSGLHHTPIVPDWPGKESFVKAGGKLIHSSEYRNSEICKDKTAMVVGAGESGSDILFQVSEVAKRSYVSLRSGPGVLFPDRVNGDTADIRDNRVIWSFPRTLWPILVASQAKFFEDVAFEPPKRKKAFNLAAKMNFDGRKSGFTINACKSFGIPEAIVYNKTETKPIIDRFENKTVYFTDGTSVQDMDVVIAATGFQYNINPIKDTHLQAKFSNPRKLWKSMLSLNEDTMFIVGFARPQQINLITCCELQARAIALIVSGQKKIPSKDDMAKDITEFADHMNHTFSKGALSLVDFFPFADGLSKFIGCAPSFKSALFLDPRLLVSMLFAPFQPSQYRLVGPGAKPKLARETILLTPFYRHRRERLMRDGMGFMILLTCGLWSILGISSKHMKIVGVARDFFELLATCWVFLIFMFLYNGFQYPAYFMSTLSIIFSAVLFNGSKESCIEKDNPFVNIAQNKFILRFCDTNACAKKDK